MKAAGRQDQNVFPNQLGDFKTDIVQTKTDQQARPLLGLSEDQLAKLSDDLRSPMRRSVTSNPLQ